MATSDPPDPINQFGATNKLQSKVNAFRKVIEGKKLEVRIVCEEMRSLVDEKEKELIQKLDAIWEEVNARMEQKLIETQSVIGEIEKYKKEIEKLFEKLKPTSKPSLNLSKDIDSAKGEMDIEIPYVNLTWRVNDLKDCIRRMCCIDKKILKDARFQLKWSKCKMGTGDNELLDPWGIAINPINDIIYVADSNNDRLQIFSKDGDWIRSVKDDQMKYPRNILFHKSIFVQCERAILKLNETTEKTEASKVYDFDLAGVCTDNDHVYVGKELGIALIVLTLDLIEENRIALKSEFCKENTEIRDISQSHGQFYVLLTETEYSIQAFSKDGILTKCVVKKQYIKNAYCFYLDNKLNFFITDYGDNKVKIFSSEGELITQFGERGTGKGFFRGLYGISVFECGSIVTVDMKESDRLQLFSI